MFGELSNLFGRNFAVGFLLPASAFLAASLFLIESFGFFTPPNSPMQFLFQTDKEILGATVLAFVLWMGGILLLALNRSIIRLKEGYGSWNPARIFWFIERKRFRKMNESIEAVESDIQLARDLREEPTSETVSRRNNLRRLAARRFPDLEEFVLPTAFGNTIRAFEVYSRVMYGLDSIPSWPRLLMVMPDNDRDMVDTAKAQMSFWVNVWLLSFVFFVEYVVLSIFKGQRGTLWALLSVPLAWFASSRARNAADMWGETVKAAFDVYIPHLREKLELSPLDREREREQWVNISRAMIYRAPHRLPGLREISAPMKRWQPPGLAMRRRKS